ncbi:MAG: tetratricopeptide repeat protein, partial [Alphaproteobacteria bacterium]|nr:tetratricopeptide repeat protein [Alphaproteobacteria bacterium]
ALLDQGQLDAAIARYEQALCLDPEHVDAHCNKSLARLMKGDFAAGWPELEWRWKKTDAKPHGHLQPLWDGGPLNGKTILLHREQGLGDNIHFIRYARLVKEKGGTVVYYAPPPLVRLFNAVAGIDHIVTRKEDIPVCDCQASLLSLPWLLETRLAAIPAGIPYLTPEPALAAGWQQYLAARAGLKVGIVWRGSPSFKNDHKRSIPATRMLDLFKDSENVTFIGLQKEITPEETAVLGLYPAFLDVSRDLADFADTAAVIAGLDLVISVDTAVAHLAGALGRPVWILLPFTPDWRWMLKREDSPWYPTAHLFRQPEFGNWAPVFERVRSELALWSQGALGDARK